ncbi:hypothetical protein JRQ81_017642 [Phrynocephalus forsythii]|uniref:Osteocrin n=1 Tax=Phrynocephalus forsythii TaxID=171643 RepID=A0A9Q0XSP7_9SAUR|nr:hypothetical protein JRQ81_017642 [Phrynocephalus forsythii]
MPGSQDKKGFAFRMARPRFVRHRPGFFIACLISRRIYSTKSLLTSITEFFYLQTQYKTENVHRAREMLLCQRAAGYLVLAITLFQWPSKRVLRAEALQEHLPFGPSLARGRGPFPPSSHERSATDLTAKLLLLDELVSLENDVTETKRKRSFSGFGSALDRLSAGSVDLKTKQRKVVELPKRRFGLPLDRIGVNRLNNSRDLPALMDAVSRRAPGSEDDSVSPGLSASPVRRGPPKKCNPPRVPSNKP